MAAISDPVPAGAAHWPGAHSRARAAIELRLEQRDLRIEQIGRGGHTGREAFLYDAPRLGGRADTFTRRRDLRRRRVEVERALADSSAKVVSKSARRSRVASARLAASDTSAGAPQSQAVQLTGSHRHPTCAAIRRCAGRCVGSAVRNRSR